MEFFDGRQRIDSAGLWVPSDSWLSVVAVVITAWWSIAEDHVYFELAVVSIHEAEVQ